MSAVDETDVAVRPKVLSAEIEPAWWERFKELAEYEDRSIAAQLRVVVREYVERHWPPQ